MSAPAKPAPAASGLDAVLLRVQKLLALATSNNVFEAASAAAAAQALIAAHRLEGLLAARAARLDGEGPGESGATIGEEVLERSRRPRRWRAVLAAGLAAENACVSYVSIGRGGQSETELRLAGARGDRQAVRSLFEWLAPRLEWLSATHGANRDRAWHEAFRVGAAEELIQRLHEVGVGVVPNPGEGALLRVDQDLRQAAVDAWAERHLRLGAGRSLRLDARGYTRGQSAAAGIALPGAGKVTSGVEIQPRRGRGPKDEE